MNDREHSMTVGFPRLPSRFALLWIIGGFFALTLIVYAASFNGHFVRWDDGMLIYENPFIRAINFATLKKIFTSYDPELYIPLTFFSYQIDYLIGGIHPGIYHLQNFLWHTGNALLVAWLCLLLSRRKWVAIVCGILFAVHPLHTEAVVWASARKDVLSTFFFLLSVIAYLSYRARGKRGNYYGSLVAFLFALLAKVSVLTLPVLLLLIDVFQGRKWSVWMIVEKLPYIALSAAFGVIAWIGKAGVLGSSTPMEKVLMAPVSAVFYLEKMFVPARLSVLYPFEGSPSLARMDILIPFVVCILLVTAMLIAWRKRPEVSFGLAFFFVTVSPTLLNFAKGDFFYFASDRYAYVPSVGILLMVAMLLARASEHSEAWAKWSTIGAVTVSILFSGLAVKQSLVWHDSTSLFTHTLSLYPDAYVALNNLGNVYRQQGETQQAVESYEKALSASERYSFHRIPGSVDTARSKILSNLGSVYRESGATQKATDAYKRALALNPGNEYAHLGMGILAGQAGLYQTAEAEYRAALQIAPEFSTALINLGALYVGMGRIEDGIREYERAIEMNPFYPQAFYNFGVALNKVNRNREAIAAYREAVALAPNFVAARLNLAILLYERQDREESVQQFEEVLRYDPTNRMALSALRQIEALGTSSSRSR